MQYGMYSSSLLATTFDQSNVACKQMKEADDIENEIEDIVQEFEIKNARTLLHTVAFY